MNKYRKRHRKGGKIDFGRGAFAGFDAYRYGENRQPYAPGKHPAVKAAINADRRKHLVAETKRQLAPWRLSHFEFEGASVAGLRSGFCLEGMPWSMANLIAADLVAEALREMGARRPNWDQAQREYTLAPDFCAGCHGPLDDADQAKGFRFCSPECARVVYERRAYSNVRQHSQIAQNAYVVIRTDEAPVLTCAHCQKPFQRLTALYESNYAGGRQKYCGVKCAHAAKVVYAPRECAACGTTFKPSTERQMTCSKRCMGKMNVKPPNATCQHCGKGFRNYRLSVSGKGKYCSRACADAGGRDSALPRECEWCGVDYRAKNTRSRFCSPICQGQSKTFRSGKWVPVKIGTRLFDHFITKPVNATPRRLTPMDLDWLLMERGARITCEAA